MWSYALQKKLYAATKIIFLSNKSLYIYTPTAATHASTAATPRAYRRPAHPHLRRGSTQLASFNKAHLRSQVPTTPYVWSLGLNN